MREIKFRVWYKKENKMFYRGYQKLSHVLLCDDDKGENEGKGVPAQRASYDDCDLLESTGVLDKNGVEIFEGDIVRIYTQSLIFDGIVGPVPDMFRSRKLHPLHDLLALHDVSDDAEGLEFEILGNRFQNQAS